LETGCDDSSKRLLWVFETNAKTIVFQGMLSPNIYALQFSCVCYCILKSEHLCWKM